MQCNMLPFKSALGCTMVVHLDGWPGHSEIRPAGGGGGSPFPAQRGCFYPEKADLRPKPGRRWLRRVGR